MFLPSLAGMAGLFILMMYFVFLVHQLREGGEQCGGHHSWRSKQWDEVDVSVISEGRGEECPASLLN